MRSITRRRFRITAIVAAILAVVSICPPAFAQTMNLSNYTMTFNQDFTTMMTLSVSNIGPITSNGPTWIAHTPYNGDWVNFEAPSGPFNPFNVGNGYLTIRAQAINGVYYGGLLSSVDGNGNGFSQKYGYFEMSAKMPTGPGSWVAFWLMSVPSLLNRSIHMDELDIVEQYGDPASTLFSTLHLWDASKSWAQLWYTENLSTQPSMTTGFNTYGVDIQPDFVTFYYNRQRIWQVPNAIPGYTDQFNQPMYIMLDSAYGGGYSGNNVSNLLTQPQDLQVQYVRVWQGSGGSNSNATPTPPTPTPKPPTPAPTSTPTPSTPTPPTATPTPGSVAITGPAAGSTVSGVVTFSCSNPGGSAYLYIDDVFIGYSSYSWNTTTFTNGSHYLLCNGYRNNSLVGSATEYVTVSNRAPTPTPIPPTPTPKPPTPTPSPTPTATPTPGPVTITSPASGSTVSGVVTFTCTNPGGSVYLYIDDNFIGYNSYSWNTTKFANGSHYLLCNGYRNSALVGSAAENVKVNN
jgi:hypothetical protein